MAPGRLPDVGRGNVLGVGVDELEPGRALELVIGAMKAGLPWRISLLAVHGVMGGALHPERRLLLNRFELNLTCGQPVRWALNLLDSAGLAERVYGPDLTIEISARAAAEGLPIFLYGSTVEVLADLSRELRRRFPALRIAGTMPSAFGSIGPDEQDAIAAGIAGSGARICLVGLGCPRQEVFIDALAERVGMPMAGVGGSFEFIAGTKPWAPSWMRSSGTEWLFRLWTEPGRLWRRFVVLNPLYLGMVAAQKVGLLRPAPPAHRGAAGTRGPVPG